MRILIVFSTAFILFSNLWAQEEDPFVQINGRVFDEFLRPLPFAHIVVKNTGEGSISDREGKFSFIVTPKDTIVFSSMGFKKSMVIVPSGLEEPFYTRDVLMKSDTIMIAEVEVYPWSDYEEFKEAFINLELPEDDLERARKNIALIKQQIKNDNNAYPNDNYRYVMQGHNEQMYNRGTTPTYQLFNVFAWSKFFKALKNGDFKNNE